MDGAVRGSDGAVQAGRIIHEESERMRTMVEDLLELSRIESGQASLRIGPVQLELLAERARQRIEVQAAERRIGVKLDVVPTPAAAVDDRRIEQVLDNLLGNALKFTPEGGILTIRARPVESGAMLAVHNTGSYIPQDDLPRVLSGSIR